MRKRKLMRTLSMMICAAMTATSIVTPVYATETGVEQPADEGEQASQPAEPAPAAEEPAPAPAPAPEPEKPAPEEKEKEPEVKKFTVKFNSKGGHDVASETVEDGDSISLPIPEHDNEQMIFVGWKCKGKVIKVDDSEFTNFHVSKDVTLKAVWSDGQAVVDDGGDEDEDSDEGAPEEVEEAPQEEIPEPVPEEVQPEVPVEESVAEEIPQEEVSDVPSEEQTVEEVPEETPEAMPETPDEAQVSDGQGEDSVSNEEGINIDTVSEGNVEENVENVNSEEASVPEEPAPEVEEEVSVPETFIVNFNTNGGEYIESVMVTSGDSVSLPIPVREGFVFEGWFMDGNKVDHGYVPLSNVTLVAEWSEAPAVEEPVPEEVTADVPEEVDAEPNVEGEADVNTETAQPNEPEQENVEVPSVEEEENKSEENVSKSEENVPEVKDEKQEEEEPVLAEYVISFDMNGAEDIDSITVTEGESVTLPEAEWYGYAFLGYSAPDGEMVDMTYTPASDVTLTANWEQLDIDYVVSFNSSGGTEVDEMVVDMGESVDLPEITRAGYDFIGWFTMDNEQVESPFTPESDVTLFARWLEKVNEKSATTLLGAPDANNENEGSAGDGNQDENSDKTNTEGSESEQLTLVFDAQNGTPLMTVAVPEDNVIASFPSVSRDGYDFLGWFLQRTSGEAVVAPFEVTENCTLYGQWTVKSEEEPVDRYSLTVDANGGTLVDGSASYTPVVKLEAGQDIWNSVSSLIPMKSGCDFAGYYDADGTLVYDETGSAVDSAYFSEGLYQGTGDLTVYAKWSEIATTYVLTYDANGGEEIAPVEYTSGSIVNGFTIPNWEGHVFDGWFTEKEGGEKITSIVMDSDKTIYAHWHEGSDEPVADRWYIYYDSQGGSELAPDGFEGTQTVTAFKTPTREGYDFLGWFVENGTEPVIQLTRDEDITLYAHWAVSVKTISYDLNGGTLNGESGIVTVLADYGSKITLPAPTREGYVFDYWDGSRYDAGDEYTVTEDHKFTAVWKLPEPQTVQYTLTYDANGGTVSVNSVVYEEGTVVSEFPIPGRTGYKFDGWFDMKEGGSKVAKLTITKDVTLYAHWTEDVTPPTAEYTLTFDPNGGVTHIDHITAEKGTRITSNEFPIPVREGYKFLGWYTEVEGGVKAGAVNLYNNVTLYAHWSKMYSVTFDYQDGARKQTYQAEQGTVLQSYFADATRSGYNFLGWYDLPTGGTKTTSYKVVGDATFYAHWEANPTPQPVPSDVKAQSLTLNTHELVVTKGEAVNLSYTLLPTNTTNQSVSWTTSDSTVVALSLTGNNQITFKAVGLGTAKITVRTQDGSNLADSCKVIVQTLDKVPDNSSSNSSGSGNLPTPVTPNNTTPQVSSYTLMITGVTGTVQKVQVNPDITLGKLATALKYTNVAKWTVKQANVSEYEISENTTMQELASLLKNGDLLIIAYDSSGKAIGSAKVVKVTDSEMNVTLSKDTNVALRSADEIAEGKDGTVDGKGKETEATSSSTSEGPGKQDSVAPTTPTGDNFAYMVYGILGSLLVLMSALYLVFRRKKTH